MWKSHLIIQGHLQVGLTSSSSRLAGWLRVTPYTLGGFGCFLSYILMLRTAGIQYVYHYVPSISNPTLFTHVIDVAVWTAISGTMACIALLVYWRRNGCRKTIALLALASMATLVSLTIWFRAVIPCLIALSCVPLVYLMYRPFNGIGRGRCFRASAYGVLMPWLLVEIGSITTQVLRIVGVSSFSLQFGDKIVGLNINLMYGLQSYSVPLLFMASFSWTAIPLLLFARKRRRFPQSSIKHALLGYAILLVSVMLSVLAMAIPYTRDPGVYGVDARYYLDKLASVGDVGMLLKLFPEDPRVMYIMLLKCLTVLGVSNELAVKGGPVILIGLNACAFYILGREILRDRLAGGFIAVFSALGMQTSMSLYAGVYANWLSLFFAALAFASYLRAVRTDKMAFLALAGLFMMLCLAAHPWSGLIYSSLLISACILDSLLKMRNHTRFLVGELMLALAVVLALVAGYFYTPHFDLAISILRQNLWSGSSNSGELFSTLAFTMNYMVGGFMSVPIFYVMALVGFSCLQLDKGSSSESRLLVLWLAITSIPLLFVEQWIQWRLIYLMPTQVLSGLGAYYISHAMYHAHEKLGRPLFTVYLFTIILVLFDYLLRSANFIPSS